MPTTTTTYPHVLKGPLPAAFWGFAWRTTLQYLVTSIQLLVDHIMVGKYVPPVDGVNVANAAMGISASIFTTAIIFVNSIFLGMGLLVGHFTGAGKPACVSRAVQQAFFALFIVAAVLAPAGYALAPTLIDLTNAEPAVRAEAVPYLRVMFMFCIGMLISIVTSTALQSAGDARTPVRLVLVMTIANILLNLLLIPKLGTVGAAIGTTMAGVLTAAYALERLLSRRLCVALAYPASFTPHWLTIRDILRLGIPTGLQDVLRNIAGLVLLRFIGSLKCSAVAHTVYGVGYNVLFRLLIILPALALRDTTKTFIVQNLAASDSERSARALGLGRRAAVAVAFLVGLVFLIAPHNLYAIFSINEPMGRQLLAHLAVAGGGVTIALVYTGAFWGVRDSRSPLYVAVASDLFMIGSCYCFEIADSLTASNIWRAIVIGHAAQAILSVILFPHRWREAAT